MDSMYGKHMDLISFHPCYVLLLHRIGELGLKVNISEMDVRVSKLDASSEVKTMAQKQIYHDIIAAALSEQAFDGVWLWGFSDRHVSTCT